MTYAQLNAYTILHNNLCAVAKNERELNLDLLATIVRHCDSTTTVEQFIQDFADANDCGICTTWEQVVEQLREQIKNGER